MQQIFDTLNRLTPGNPRVYRNLALFPLIDEQPAQATYDTLDETLADGTIRISEIGDSGSVPRLQLHNDSDRAVLLLDGEELIGAKQNRVLNITMMVGPHCTTLIPVSCVEQGRWGFTGKRDFSSAGRSMNSRARASKMGHVSENMRTSNTRDANQSQVWQDVEACAVGFDVQSPTGAMSDIYESQEDHLKPFMKAFDSVPGQTGAVFAINGIIAGCEVFDSSSTWKKLGPKLINSYALDALQADQLEAEVRAPIKPQDFLLQIGKASASRHEALGLGEDIRLNARGLVGGALMVDNSIVHLSAFSQPQRRGYTSMRDRSRLSSPATRRRNRN